MKWNVTLTATIDGGTAGIASTLDVTSASTQLGTVTLTNTAGSSVDFAVTIQGLAGAVNITSADSVVKGGGSNGTVTLADLRTSGNVGAISVDAITQVRVGGNLTGNIIVSNGNLGTLWVDGNVSGDTEISVTKGRIDFINLPNSGSDFGEFDDSASIYASDEIRNIFVDDRRGGIDPRPPLTCHRLAQSAEQVGADEPAASVARSANARPDARSSGREPTNRFPADRTDLLRRLRKSVARESTAA
ncbi:MAG: DUF4402 domain-containing protein [Phycisphaeraceae bacterium]|nr:DUF4402 domain-containing protein [Phycisphaeraceae bacterium]